MFITHQQPNSRERPLILIVDDVELNVLIVKDALEKEGFETATCTRAARVIEMVRALQPDLILMDYIMPELDGPDVCRLIRAIPEGAHLPIIFLTSNEHSDDLLEAFESGATDYVTKPFIRVELLARVRNHLNFAAQKKELMRVQEQLNSQMEQAAAYVRDSFPPPMEKPIRVCWHYETTGRIGGEALGYQWIDPDHFAFYQIDAEAGGIQAALIAVSISHWIRHGLHEEDTLKDPARILSGVQSRHQPSQPGNFYFSIAYGVLRLSTRELSYASAGHPPLLIFKPDCRTIESIRTCTGRSTAVDGSNTEPFTTRKITLDQPSRLLLHSDGIFKLRDTEGHSASYQGFLEYMLSIQSHESNLPAMIFGEMRREERSFLLGDGIALMQIDL